MGVIGLAFWLISLSIFLVGSKGKRIGVILVFLWAVAQSYRSSFLVLKRLRGLQSQNLAIIHIAMQKQAKDNTNTAEVEQKKRRFREN